MLAAALDELLVRIFKKRNRATEWHKQSKWVALLNLLALRVELRRHNLHDTDGDLKKPKPGCPFHPLPEGERIRTSSGTQNDLDYPAMGCRGTRLGRNVRREWTKPDVSKLLTPNPLMVSKELLARKVFKPASSLNLLAAAWIQFQVHDWFGHEDEDLDSGKMHCVPRAGDWTRPQMDVPKTRIDPETLTPLDEISPAYRNEDPQWWDGSQIYGETDAETLSLRTDPTGKLCPGGHLFVDRNGLLPIDPNTGATISGFTDNWWLGLELLHTLFVKEHNLICDTLRRNEKALSDDEIFEKARLINSAVLAKIHTVEWTPGIISHPAIKPALDANWMGLLGHWFGESLARKIAGFLPTEFPLKDVMTGIPLSDTDHHGAPFALTEEFAAVYRLHPLIPDEVMIRKFGVPDGAISYKMEDLAFRKARAPFDAGASMEDVVYSFVKANPGAITIENYPKFLRDLKLPPDPKTGIERTLDLAAVDILRDRERGVPRYNEFRRQLRKPPVKDWVELAGGDAALATTLKRVYNDELEDVDTMVGMFCEPLPQGFGFSDTAFRIFILMATRRLKSDRFFTTAYRAEIYTKTGLAWIQNTGMREVIVRHHPRLAQAFVDGQNPFAPWK